jgi:tetratricopeptide (TPR) repeat protein
MILDLLQALDLSDIPDYDAKQEYDALQRALQRQKGFGIIFVQCSPDQGQTLIKGLREDLPRKRCEVLTLTEPLPEGDFFRQATAFLAEHPVDVLFVSGLEHSILDYEETKRQSGWTAEESRGYSWRGVPPVLRNLNQQRDRFRNELETCFVFLVPLFLVKYLTRRAPDFFDWRSGVFEFPDDRTTLEQRLVEFRIEDPSKIQKLSEAERTQRALEIKDLLANPEIQSDQKFRLLNDLGWLQLANEDNKSFQTSLLKAINTDVTEVENYHLKGELFSFFNRDEEAIASYDKALEIKPDKHDAWYNRGISLDELGRYEEAIASYDKALECKPDFEPATQNRRIALQKINSPLNRFLFWLRGLFTKGR